MFPIYVRSLTPGTPGGKQGSGEAAGKCRALLDAGRLERVLAGDARWAGLRNALLDALQGTTEGPPKARIWAEFPGSLGLHGLKSRFYMLLC